MKKILITTGLAIFLLVGGSLWSRSLVDNNPDVISSGSIHWHPRLTIFVQEKQIAIPQDLGIGPQFAAARGYDPQMQMTAMHTHDDLPIIHLEFMRGPVYTEDVTLGAFFRMWGKDMRQFGPNMRMTVNGNENTDYENFIMHDGDTIELHYD